MAPSRPASEPIAVVLPTLYGQVRSTCSKFGNCDPSTAADIALHVGLWLVDRRRQALRWIHDEGATDHTLDDLDLVAELLLAACARG
jgi:hypothetical protein